MDIKPVLYNQLISRKYINSSLDQHNDDNPLSHDSKSIQVSKSQMICDAKGELIDDSVMQQEPIEEDVQIDLKKIRNI
jgi:hypothetical protein